MFVGQAFLAHLQQRLELQLRQESVRRAELLSASDGRIALARSSPAEASSPSPPLPDVSSGDEQPDDGDEQDLRYDFEYQSDAWSASDVGFLGGPQDPPPSEEKEPDEPEEKKEAGGEAAPRPRFAAPVQRRHRLPKFAWARNPLLLRIHSLCLQHYVFAGMRPVHTERTLKCLGDDGLGPSALSELGRTMLSYNTTDFRMYVDETVPRTKTSCVEDFLLYCRMTFLPSQAARWWS